MNWNERRAMLMGLTPRGPVFNKPDDAGAGGTGDDDTGGDAADDDAGTDRSDPEPGESKIKGGLLDRRSKADDASGDDPDKGAKPKDTPDDGRPEGLADKFWDADKKAVRQDVLAKSYTELEAAHGKLKREKTIGGEVPENAEDYFKDGLDLGDGVKRLTVEGPDDPGLKAWGEVCHKRGIGKEMAVDLAKDMFGLMDEFAPEPIDPEAEFEKLGKGAEAIVDGIFTWADGAERSGKLSEDDVEIVAGLSQTANGIKFLAAMRSMAGEERIPLVPSTGARGMSADQWSEEYKTAVANKDYKRQEELDEMDVGQRSRMGGVDPEKRLTGKKS